VSDSSGAGAATNPARILGESDRLFRTVLRLLIKIVITPTVHVSEFAQVRTVKFPPLETVNCDQRDSKKNCELQEIDRKYPYVGIIPKMGIIPERKHLKRRKLEHLHHWTQTVNYEIAQNKYNSAESLN